MPINKHENFGYITIMFKSQVNRTEPNGFAELTQVQMLYGMSGLTDKKDATLSV